MTCLRELKGLLEDAQGSKPSDFRDGYIVALEEAIVIVESHEDEGE